MLLSGQGLNRAYQMCRAHFYKVLVLSVIGLMALQYVLSVTFYGGKSYFLSSYSYKVVEGGGNGSKIEGSFIADTLPSSTLASLNVTKLQLNNNIDAQNRDRIVSQNVTTEVTNASFTSTIPTVTLPLCPPVPPKLVGPLKVVSEAPSMSDLEAAHPELLPGGRFRPLECTSRHRVAIIIPYRDREPHLRLFLNHLHPILQRQQLDYGIFVIEEAGTTKFNRAMLMNIGFIEALKQYDWQCFVFHDVDLLPENDLNIYSCPTQPRHMSVAVDTMNYKLPYTDIFGGVSALTKEQMVTVNGFSNEFWGWGGEDDDMSNRIRHYGYQISRYPPNIARYKMMKHHKDTPNPDRYNKLYKGKSRFKTDGINSAKYNLKLIVLKKLYTLVNVELKQPK